MRRDFGAIWIRQDLIRLEIGRASVGLRWTIINCCVNQKRGKPTSGIARYLPARMWYCTLPTIECSRRRHSKIFYCPVRGLTALNPNVLRLPCNLRVKLLRSGTHQGFAGRVSLMLNISAECREFCDDDQLLNTGVSFPIAFRKSVYLRSRGQDRVSASRKPKWIRKLLLHGGFDVLARDRRPFSRR